MAFSYSMLLQKSVWILLLICSIANGQGGFRKFYAISGTESVYTNDVLERPDGGYIVVGAASVVQDTVSFSQLILVGIDSCGHIEWQKSYGSRDCDFPFNMDQNAMVYCKGAKAFLLTGLVRDSTGVGGMLMALNYSGDTIWMKHFSDSLGPVFPTCITQTMDGGYLLAGALSFGSVPAFVCKLDSLANEIWRVIIHKSSPNYLLPSWVTQDNVSKNFILAGSQYIGNGYHDLVLILDSTGKKIAQKTFNDPCSGSAKGILGTGDGNFIIGGQYNVSCQDGLRKGTLTKFTRTGQLVEQYIYPRKGYLNFLYIIQERANGDLVCIGNLDTAWQHQLQYIVMDPQYQIKSRSYFGRRHHIQFDMIRGGMVTKDNGYVIAIQLAQEAGIDAFCMIKLDSLGCDTVPEYCAWERSVGLKEQRNLIRAQMFPNPCSDALNLTVETAALPARLRVFDQSGRVLREEDVLSQSHRLNTSQLSQGLYLLEIRGEAGVFRGNFVVER